MRNVTGSIYSDMLTNSGLCASHDADRMGTKDFYKVLCAVGGHSLLSAERGSTTAPMQPPEILQSMLDGAKDTHYYFGVPHADGASMLSLQFELKPEEQDVLRLVARAQTPLYAKSMELILASGAVGTCFLLRLDSISHHLPGNVHGSNAHGKKLFVVA